MTSLRTRLFNLAQSVTHRLLPRVDVPFDEPSVAEGKPLKGAVIGLGVIGREHLQAIRACPATQLSAVCSRQPASTLSDLASDAAQHRELADLIAAEAIDFLTIATPHPSHFERVKTALDAGIHVLCEKPLCISATDAFELSRIAKANGLVLQTAFQTRYSPSVRYAKSLLESGQFGRVLRCEMSENYWRSANYYEDSSWRGTWATEGGGVLVNQAPHILDRYLYLFGAPSAVLGQSETMLHDIEVEDTVTAILKYDSGLNGFVRVSTAEAPWKSRLYIAGDRGTLEIENGIVKQTRFAGALAEDYLHNADRSPDHEATFSTFRTVSKTSELQGLYAGFVSAIASDKSSDDLDTGATQVALSNAISLSQHGGKRIEFPVDLKKVSDLMSKRGAPIHIHAT